MRENTTDTMMAKKSFNKKQGSKYKGNQNRRKDESPNTVNKETFKYKCHQCHKISHKASECNERSKNGANMANDLSLCAIASLPFARRTNESDGRDSTEVRAWCLDSGCSAHMYRDEENFVEYNSTIGKVNLANKASIGIEGKGSVCVTANLDDSIKQVNINNTLHVPELKCNLLSVGKICDKGFKVLFEADGAAIIDKDKKIALKADQNASELYYLRTTPIENNANAEWNNETTVKLSTAEVWHRKMGHLNYRDLIKCSRVNAMLGMQISDHPNETDCEVCARAKMVKSPFPRKSNRNSEILEIVHSDVCGPMCTESIGKSRYFVTFIDDASRWCEIKFLRQKSVLRVGPV